MASSLIVVLLLGWIAIRNIHNLGKEEQLLKETKAETATLIKYDNKTVKLINILSKVAAVIFLVACYLAETVWPEAGMIVFPAGFVLIILCAYHWCGKQYLKRLHKFGYIVPENSKEYDSLLERLPKAEVKQIDREPYNRRSKVFWMLCMFAFVVMLAVTVWYYCSWSFMEDNAIFMVVVLAVTDLFWLFAALRFRKQMSNEAFKEDVEIDKNRKNRMSLEYAVLLIVIMLLLTGFVKTTAHSMTKYIYNAWVDADRDEVRKIQSALEQAYDELVLDNEEQDSDDSKNEGTMLDNWEVSRTQLAEGVDITNWGVPQDIYQEKVAAYLEISDFSELKDDFRSAKGDAVLYAKLEKGLIRVSLPNLHKEVRMPIIISSEKNIK